MATNLQNVMKKGLGLKREVTKKDNMNRMVDEPVDEKEEDMLGKSYINDIHLQDQDDQHA